MHTSVEPVRVTNNVHLLTQLPASVGRWRPLWSHSAFFSEDANGKLLKAVEAELCIMLITASETSACESDQWIVTHEVQTGVHR